MSDWYVDYRVRTDKGWSNVARLEGDKVVSALPYDDQALALNPISYWKFENDGVDEQGLSNASITGSPELNVSTIVDNDVGGECIAWRRTPNMYAQVGYNSAYKTAAGTVAVTVQLDTIISQQILVASNANVTATGEFSLEVRGDGVARAFIFSAGAVENQLLVSGMQTHQAYTLILKWGSPGMSLALWDDAGNVDRATNAVTQGLAGTSPIRFGAWHSGASPMDGVYGRVLWFNRRVSDVEEATIAQAKTISHVPATYDEQVISLNNPSPPLSYWKFENDGIDEQGLSNASITGSPELHVPTIVNNDVGGECIAWPGEVGTYAQVGYNSAYKTAAGTIAVTFRLDVVAAQQILIASNIGNTVTGEFSLEVTNGGAPRAFIWSAGQTSNQLLGPAGSIQPSHVYTLILKWGSPGMSMALWGEAGALVDRRTNAVTQGLASTSPIRFGSWHDGSSPVDGAYGRVLWFNRRISDAEEVTIAQAQASGPIAPVAFADTGWFVAESSFNDLNVLANDIIGTGTLLSVDLQSAVNCTVIHQGAGIVRITAGSLGACSFQYRLVTTAGTSSFVSNTGTVGSVSSITQLGAWPLSETSGTAFADTVNGNTATLSVPSWTVATHEHNRPGIVAGSDHALEVSNGGPAIPMASGYKQDAMSLVIYVAPLSELRGVQHYDTSAEGYGRELIAHCDDGSTPGSFAIERRRFSATEWRLDGYVRNDAGTAVRFSGGLSGIAGATLPVDALSGAGARVGTAKRVVLTQGPAGAELWLNNAKVGTLASAPGWGALSTAITLGSSSNTGHANDRSPLWGRLDQIEVWSGQMGDVQTLPAAAQSNLWRYPSDFVGGATDINIANYPGNAQAAMDAAHAASRYVYQTEGDTTYYTNAMVADNLIAFRPNCKGLINVRLKQPNLRPKFSRLVNMAEDSGGQMGAHGDPYASTGGYKFIGCKFDGNSRGQDWHPHSGEPGYTRHAFDLEQQHSIYHNNASAAKQTATVDACEFYDGCGDGMSIGTNSVTFSASNRFYGQFRGPHVINEAPAKVDVYRCETFNRSVLGTVPNGTGLQDIEAFGGAGGLMELRFVDVWAQGDFDDESEGQLTNASYVLYHNVHTTGASCYINTAGESSNRPVSQWNAYYCTFSYHSNGGNGSGNFPSSWWKGMVAGTSGLGCLFDHCIFVANGTPYYYHESWLVTPNSTKRFYINYDSAGTQSRLWTMRTCEFRVKNLPAGLSTSNVQAVDHGSMSTSQSVELDGVIIDGAFANAPFEMGGVTVRHRDVQHLRTGSSTPWTGAGNTVPI